MCSFATNPQPQRFASCGKESKRMSVIKKTLMCALLAASMSATAQVCLDDKIQRTTQSEQFLDNGDGTVTDAKTGLMWMQCSLGQVFRDGGCSGGASIYTWQQALRAAQTLNLAGGWAGYVDWRVPNIKELGSLVEAQCYSPAIDLDLFPDTPSGTYWSSTPDSRDGRVARAINFVDGSDLTPEVRKQRYVRLVRNTGTTH